MIATTAAVVTIVRVVQETILPLKDFLVRLVPLLTLLVPVHTMWNNLKVKISVHHALLVLIVPKLQWLQLLNG